MDSPSFSVVIRTCRRPWFLARALASVWAQVDVAPEVVVVLDGESGAEEREVLTRFREMGMALVEVRLNSHGRRGASWNAGLQAATGSWLASLDDDDTWEPEFLKTIRSAITARRSDNLFGVATQTLEVREKAEAGGWAELARRPLNPRFRQVRLQDLVLLNRFTNNAFVFPKAALAQVGLIQEDLTVLEDWEFNVRFARQFPVVVIPSPLACYHRREGDASSSSANTASADHLVARGEIREAWLREDLQAGRFGLGVLALMAEIESNRGLRLFNRIASWFGR